MLSSILHRPLMFFFFFFNDTATTEIYTLSLHDALPISRHGTHCRSANSLMAQPLFIEGFEIITARIDRKSTRLNSSHSQISYAVFCLKKKKKHTWQRCSASKLEPAQRHLLVQLRHPVAH